MRFRFCGDLDCPDWVLAEINILARLTSVKMKLLVGQVMKGLLDDEIDFDKVQKLTADAKYDVGDVKASVAGLHFIISSGAKHGVDASTLSSELQQLGLPKEHSAALCKTYEAKSSALHDEIMRTSFRRSSVLQEVDWKINPLQGGEQRTVDVRLILQHPTSKRREMIEFSAEKSKFRVLLHELKIIQSRMNSIEI